MDDIANEMQSGVHEHPKPADFMVILSPPALLATQLRRLL
jgi:hypothetical protein